MIARAFVRQDPFEVWGTGQQLRNWTYISDIVEDTLRAAEAFDGGEAVNIGTMEGVRVIDAARLILRQAGYSATIVTRPDMPTGPYYRIADNRKLAERTGWKPEIAFEDGLRPTMNVSRPNRNRLSAATCSTSCLNADRIAAAPCRLQYRRAGNGPSEAATPRMEPQ
jgi:nucleoside-diphosphate-sugar epimerase